MSESVRQGLPSPRSDELITFPTSAEQHLVISKAAELLGWTVPQYVLCAALDRAERDLYEHAALNDPPPHPAVPGPDGREGAAGPLTALLTALGS
ncbi:type II toxin -antitoxin system TacA 1-like antitoxin [Actinomadura kijaniata]|uniref:type II toxin -antitoxin system TacA 1-like antitoxin n=1 Tax=Actinomadura kijaniata TaxID=46161 RepID=UPI0008354355|nr:DUF1778 domain-containing protein [Actinomadura kijaniata]